MRKISGVIFLSLTLFMFNFSDFNAAASYDLNDHSSETQKVDEGSYSNKGATKYVFEIEKKLENIYGSIKDFEKIGGLYFDTNGVLHLNYKKPADKLLKEKTSQSIISILGDDNLLSEDVVDYSTSDLIEIKEKVNDQIQEYFSEEEYKTLSFLITASFPEQKVILEYRNLPKKLIQQLKEEYSSHLLEFKFTNQIYETSKARTDDWNQLGAGLALKNTEDGTCTMAGVAHKNNVYYILTAGHCFKGETSPTGGALIRQYNVNVGRQHAEASTWKQLDAGLVRVTTDNALPYGRYATNKVRRWSTTEEFDGIFTNSMRMYNGVEICKTGNTTNTTCGTVADANTTVKYKDYPTTYKVAYIEDANVKGGDSGGAGFFQVNATDLILTGIVSGRKRDLNDPDNSLGVFLTQYKDFESAYDISLYTSNTNYKIVN